MARAGGAGVTGSRVYFTRFGPEHDKRTHHSGIKLALEKVLMCVDDNILNN